MTAWGHLETVGLPSLHGRFSSHCGLTECNASTALQCRYCCKSRRGSINGGFFQKSNDKPDQYPSVVIAVENIKEHIKKVKEAGGEPLGEPMEIPGVGLYLSCRDTEGNRVAMLQPLSGMQVHPK